MPANFPSSDRVRLEPQERFDLPDAVGIQQMVDEAMQRHFGALLGQGSGLASPPKLTWDANTKLLTHGPFQYYLASPKALMTDDGGATWKGWNGGFFDFNPTASGQVATVDLSGAFAAAMVNLTSEAALPFVYAQPVKIDQDLDGRKKWQGGTEASMALLTRTRIRTAFKVVTAATSPMDATNDGWACIGKVTAWSGNLANPGTPTVTPVSYFDNPEAVACLPTVVGTWWDGGENVGALLKVLAGGAAIPGVFQNSGNSKSKVASVVQMVMVLRDRLAAHLDHTKQRFWYDQPVSTDGALTGGLRQLLDYVQSLLTYTAAYSGAAGLVTFAGGVPTLAYAHNAAAIEDMGVGQVRVTLQNIPAGKDARVVVANGAATTVLIVPNIFGSPRKVEFFIREPNTLNLSDSAFQFVVIYA